MNLARKARSPLHGRLQTMNHQQAAGRSSRVKCPYPGCDKDFAHSDSLLRHFELHVSTKAFECHYCDRIYQTPYQRSDHVVHVHSDRYEAHKRRDSQDKNVRDVKEQVGVVLQRCRSRQVAETVRNHTVADQSEEVDNDDDDDDGPPELECMEPEAQALVPPSTVRSSERLHQKTLATKVKSSKRRINKTEEKMRKYKDATPAECELCENKKYSHQSSYVRHCHGLHWRVTRDGLVCDFCDGTLFQNIRTDEEVRAHALRHRRRLQAVKTMFLVGFGRKRAGGVAGSFQRGYQMQDTGEERTAPAPRSLLRKVIPATVTSQNAQMMNLQPHNYQNGTLPTTTLGQLQASASKLQTKRKLFQPAATATSSRIQDSALGIIGLGNSTPNGYFLNPPSRYELPSHVGLLTPPVSLLSPGTSSSNRHNVNLREKQADNYVRNQETRVEDGNRDLIPVVRQNGNAATATGLTVFDNAVFQTVIPVVKIEPPEIVEIATYVPPAVPRFPCPYKKCRNSFSTDAKLQNHKSKHKLIRKIVCKICKKTAYLGGSSSKYCISCIKAIKVKQEAELEAYKPKSWVMLPMECFECGASFSSESSLVSHLKTEHMDSQNGIRRECPVCSFILENAREYFLHTRAHAFDRDRPVWCKEPTETCKQQFKNEEDLAKHYKAAHPNLDLAQLETFVGRPPLVINKQKLKARRAQEYHKPQKPVPKLGFFKPNRKLLKTRHTPVGVSGLEAAAAPEHVPVLTVSAKQNEQVLMFSHPKNMCFICKCCFQNGEKLGHHVVYAHNRTPTIYKCQDCNFSCKNAMGFQEHNVEHQREFPYCCKHPRFPRCFRKCRTFAELCEHYQSHGAAPMK